MGRAREQRTLRTLLSKRHPSTNRAPLPTSPSAPEALCVLREPQPPVEQQRASSVPSSPPPEHSPAYMPSSTFLKKRNITDADAAFMTDHVTADKPPTRGLLRRGKTVFKGVGHGFALRTAPAPTPPVAVAASSAPATTAAPIVAPVSPPTTPPPIASLKAPLPHPQPPQPVDSPIDTRSAPNLHTMQPEAETHQSRNPRIHSNAAYLNDDDKPYSARVARVSKTGIVERSVAAAVISAARQRAHRKPRPELPPHHRLHGGFTNPWASALKENSLRARGGSGSRTFFHKVAKDRRPPDELLASMLLLADRPDFSEGAEALEKDKYALASTWIGHCTFLLQMRGLTILTDPVWSNRLGPLGPRRLIPPPCEIDQLPQTIDAVILSSACYDHYDKTAVAALSTRVTTWLVPLGLKHLLLTAGIAEASIVELDWWQEHSIGDNKFVCTPAQHYSIRDDALWCSWVIRSPHHRIFFAGATGYRSVSREIEDSEYFEQRDRFGGPCCPVFKEIYRRYGSCDTAFLPIGGFKPRLVMSGVQGDAVDMLFIHRDLHARRSVAHRWGTFACNDEGMLDAVRALEKALADGPVSEHEFSYLKHGRVHVT